MYVPSSACNRVAIITGGAQGIGRGIANYLLGYTAGHAAFGSYCMSSRMGGGGVVISPPPKWGIVIVDVDDEGLEDAKRVFAEFTQPSHYVAPTTQAEDGRGEKEKEGGGPSSSATTCPTPPPPSAFTVPPRIVFVKGDCASETTAREALQTALKAFGRVDLLVNNAGGGLPKVPLRGQTVAEFYEILHRNVGTAYVFSKIIGSYWEELAERDKARIAGVDSVVSPSAFEEMVNEHHSPNNANTAVMTSLLEGAKEGGGASVTNRASSLASAAAAAASKSLSPLLGATVNYNNNNMFTRAPMGYGTNMNNAIVNISSTRANQSEHFSEPYAAGKGGVVALTHALASSLSHIARVNGINLGWIDVSSPQFGPNREQYHKSNEDISQHWCNKVGEADDVAHAVMFLYENYFMNGQCITLDGGMSKRMAYAE